MLFVINGIDFSDHIPAGTYEISDVELFESWTDANYDQHRECYAKKVRGSVDMWFKTEEDFARFRDAIDAVKQHDLSVPMVVTCNNTGENKSINAFLDFTLTRNIDGFWQDYFEQFSVEIEEQ